MRSCLAILALILVLPATTVADGSSPVEYATEVGARGRLVLRLPPAWSVRVEKRGNGQPPTIHLAGDAGGPFQVDITPTWPRQHSPLNFGSAAHMRAAVEAEAGNSAGAAAGKTPLVVELGGGNPGYYFESDSSVAATGDPGVVVYGMARVGKLVCVVQGTGTAGTPAVRDSVLDVLRTAVHQSHR